MPRIGEKIRHIIPISGKDSLCTALVQMRRAPTLPYEFIFCDVRMELPETYTWLQKVESSLGITITRMGRSLEEVIAEFGMLPGHTYRFCTKAAKITPMQEYIESHGDRAIQYLGFRADEKDRLPPPNLGRDIITTKFPLIEEGIELADVYRILTESKVMPPTFFWLRLYNDVYEMCSETSKRFLDNTEPWTRSYLFSWRSRSNCFMCFYQRLYEWVGLLEFHPQLFQRAEVLEDVYGRANSEYRLEKHEDFGLRSDYYFHQGWPLARIRERAKDIYIDRVRAVYKLVVGARHREPQELDRLSSTSCGAMCGK